MDWREVNPEDLINCLEIASLFDRVAEMRPGCCRKGRLKSRRRVADRRNDIASWRMCGRIRRSCGVPVADAGPVREPFGESSGWIKQTARKMVRMRKCAKGSRVMLTRGVIVTGVVLGVVLAAGAQERKITRKELPAAVAATVDRETKGATIKGFTTERELGHTTYEAETVVNGHTRDIEIAQDGTLNEVEEEVSFASLPANVQQALRTKAKGGKITKVESLKKHGRLVAYEAGILRNGKHSEIQVGTDGGTLAHEE